MPAPLSELLEKLEREATKGPISVQPPHGAEILHRGGYTHGKARLGDTGGDIIADYFTKGGAELDAALRNNLAIIRACVELAEALGRARDAIVNGVSDHPQTEFWRILQRDVWDLDDKVRAAKEGK